MSIGIWRGVPREWSRALLHLSNRTGGNRKKLAHSLSPELEEELHCVGDWAQEQVAQRSFVVSLFGGIQEFFQCALGWLCLSRELEPLCSLPNLPILWFCFCKWEDRWREALQYAWVMYYLTGICLTSLILKCSFCFALLSNSFKKSF